MDSIDKFMTTFFGEEFQNAIEEETNVDKAMKNMVTNLQPSDRSVKIYLQRFYQLHLSENFLKNTKISTEEPVKPCESGFW